MGDGLKAIDINDNSLVIELLKSGEEEPFDCVYTFYFPKLYAFCCQYVQRTDAEEIVQDTFVWLWENRDKLISEFSLKTLLFTIVKNKALNKISHYQVKHKVLNEIAEKFDAQFSSPDFYLETEVFQLFRNALNSLPEEFRQAYEMNRFDHLTHKEIAEKLNVSPQLVNYRIGQVLKVLRAELKDYLPICILMGWLN